jgi:cytoskeletal protein CcmA (bactofilin family)
MLSAETGNSSAVREHQAGLRGAVLMADYGSIRQHWNRVSMAAPEQEANDDEGISPTVASRNAGTFIGPGAIFDGTLTLKGDFRIDTEFRGELATDGMITVGPQGSVVGSIRAREVIIRGAVVGNVHAPRQLIVEAEGKLHGDIETACLEIQKHAFFQGNTAMTKPQASRRLQNSETPPVAGTYAPPL